MTESTLRSFSSSGRGVVRIPLGDKRKFEEGGVWGETVQIFIRGVWFSGVLGLMLEGKSVLNSNVFEGFHKKHQK